MKRHSRRPRVHLRNLDMPNRRPEKAESFSLTDRFRTFFGTLAGGGGVIQALTRFMFPGYGGQSGTTGGGFFNLFGDHFSFKGKRVNLNESAPVVATLNWICRTFVEADLAVWRAGGDGAQKVANHPLFMVLKRPNPAYSWSSLFQAIVVSLYHDGNAYLLKQRREGDNAVVSLWFVPYWMIEPQWPFDGTVFISHYIYQVNGKTLYVRPEDVIHIRKGLDPANTRKGFGVLKSVIKEVFTDEAAQNFSAWMLDNYAIPGVIIAPDEDNVEIDETDAEEMKQKFLHKFGGEHIGEPMFLTYKAKVFTVGHNPKDLALKEIRRIPEERISAVTGVPSIVANLGAGLDSSTYNNLENLKRAATNQTLVPLWRDVAEQMTLQLLVDFSNRQDEFLEFDTSQVKELREDETANADRTRNLFTGDIITRAEARLRIGEKPDDKRDNIFFSDVRQSVLAGRVPPALPDSGNGNGKSAHKVDDHGLTGLVSPRLLLMAGDAASLAQKRGAFRDMDLAADVSQDELVSRLSAAFRDMADNAENASQDVNENAPVAESERITDFALGRETEHGTPANLILAAILLMQTGSNTSVKHIVSGMLHIRVDEFWTAEVEAAVEKLQGARRLAYIKELRAQTRDAVAQAIRDIKAGKTEEEIAARIASMVSGRAMYPGIYDRAFEAARQAGASDTAAAITAEAAARKYRAGLIAKTETITAQNIAAIESFAGSGMVSKVKVFDGDGCGWTNHDDPDKAHGTERPLTEARKYALAHPNCVRRFEPIIDAVAEAATDAGTP